MPAQQPLFGHAPKFPEVAWLRLQIHGLASIRRPSWTPIMSLPMELENQRRTRKPPFETASTRQFSYLRPWRKYWFGKERVVSGRCPKNKADFDGLVFWVLTSQELGDSVLIALNHHLPKVSSASGGDGRMCQPSGPVTCMDIHVCANVCGHAHSHAYGNVCRHVCRQMCSHGGWLEFQPCFGPAVV